MNSIEPHTARRPLLVVVSTFYPFGGSGSRGTIKLLKYLDRLGRPAVVVTKPRVWNPLPDPTLTPPASTRIVRTKNLEPWLGVDSGRALLFLRKLINFSLVPDSSVLWSLGGAAEAINIAREVRPAAILASAPQFGAFLIAEKIKQATGIPLILEYRDEWSQDPIKTANAARSKIRSLKLGLERKMELRIASRADAIIASTEAFKTGMIEHLGFDPDRITVINNGYDPEDFPAPGKTRPRSSPVIFTHFGSINHQTMVAEDFFNEIERAAERAHTEVELRYVGNVFPDLRQRLEARPPGRLKIKVIGFQPAAEAYRLLAESDLCVLVPKDLPGKERYHNMRLFDYLGLRQVSLIYGRNQSMDADVAEKSGIVRVVERGDLNGLAEFFDSWFAGRLAPFPHEDYIEGLSYQRLAARLENTIQSLERKQGGQT